VTGIPFDSQGFPDFSSVAEKKVRVPHTGDNYKDFAAADKAAGITSRPLEKTAHQDGYTFQLVPYEIHRLTGHTGSTGIGNLPGKK
jgi:hypothetical protein